jgi:hypothetical protein
VIDVRSEYPPLLHRRCFDKRFLIVLTIMQDASWLTIGESVDIFEVGSGTGTDTMDPVMSWLAN